MSERYKKLYQLPHRLYASHAPVLIEGGALLLEQQSNAMLCQLCFRNLQERPIKMLRAKVQMLDAQGDPLGAPTDHRYQALELGRDETCGRDSAIVLPDHHAAAFSVQVTQVNFADGDIWAEENAVWEELPDQKPLDEAEEDEQLRLRFLRRLAGEAPMAPLETEELWFCVCGAANHSAEGRCHRCRTRRALLFGKGALPTPEELEEASFHAGSPASDPDRRKRLRGLLFGALGVVALAVLVIVLLPRLKSSRPAPQAAQQDPVPAAVQSQAAGGQDASSPVSPQDDPQEAAYLEALDLQARAESVPEGDDDFYQLYLSAAEAFEALGDYRDSESRALQCREQLVLRSESVLKEDYAAARALLEGGHYSEARAAFLALGNYEDSADQAAEATYQKGLALFLFADSHALRGVTASLSMDAETESLVALPREQLLELGSEGAAELVACFGADPVRLIPAGEDGAPTEALEDAAAALLRTLGDYRNSAEMAAMLPDMVDRSEEFFALLSAGELDGARDWLSAPNHSLEDRELWLQRLDSCAAFAGDWQLRSGDPPLPAAVGGSYDKCYALRCQVLLDRNGAATLRFLLHEGDQQGPELLADPDSYMFLFHTKTESFVAQLSNAGSLSLIKLRDGAITGGVEYIRP